jgi:hypothetical protein
MRPIVWVIGLFLVAGLVFFLVAPPRTVDAPSPVPPASAPQKQTPQACLEAMRMNDYLCENAIPEHKANACYSRDKESMEMTLLQEKTDAYDVEMGCQRYEQRAKDGLNAAINLRVVPAPER